MSETRTLWQRCEALGQFEDYQDDHVSMSWQGNRWIIMHDDHVILYIYEDHIQGSEWLADAVISRIERLVLKLRTIRDQIGEALRNEPKAHRFQLPDVTYVVEAPNPTEPTQEQLKAIWDHVTSLTGEQAESFGFQYAVIGLIPPPRFELKIESLRSNMDEWKATIIHSAEGEFSLTTTLPFAGLCSRLGCFGIARGQQVKEYTNQFVSIPVTEWKQLREAASTIQSILFPEIKDVDYED